MSNFNYFPHTPYTNPAGEIEKQTNELPVEMKAETVEKKRATRAKKTTRKVKKDVSEK